MRAGRFGERVRVCWIVYNDMLAVLTQDVARKARRLSCSSDPYRPEPWAGADPLFSLGAGTCISPSIVEAQADRRREGAGSRTKLWIWCLLGSRPGADRK